YVSLMSGGPDSRAPAARQLLDPASSDTSINQFSAYLETTFASVRQTTRTAPEIRTASISRTSTFAERFDGVMSVVAAASAPTRSITITAPKVRTAVVKPTTGAPNMRAATLRMEARDLPAPDP